MTQAERVIAHLAEQIKTLILEKAILEANNSILEEQLAASREKETAPPIEEDIQEEEAPTEALF